MKEQTEPLSTIAYLENRLNRMIEEKEKLNAVISAMGEYITEEGKHCPYESGVCGSNYANATPNWCTNQYNKTRKCYTCIKATNDKNCWVNFFMDMVEGIHDEYRNELHKSEGSV